MVPFRSWCDRSQLTHLDHVHGVVVGVGIVVGLPIGVEVDPVEVVVVLVQVVLHVDHEGGQPHHEGQEVEGVRAAQETLLETLSWRVSRSAPD